MLKSLSIKNYAIIDELTVDFAQGFNVFTGETGAGKSIIIGALSFLLKGRSDTSIIRKGADKAIIEAVFTISSKDLLKELADNDIDYDDELIIRRVVAKEKGSSIRINGVAVTLSFLSSLSERLIDIHSQRDSLFLLNNKHQLDIIDRYARLDKSAYQELYRKYQAKKKELAALNEESLSEREAEFLKFDLKELEEADLSIDEEKELEEKEQLAKNVLKYTSAFNTALSLYEDEGGIKEKFYDLIDALDINDDLLKEAKDKIDNLYYELDDQIETLRSLKNKLDFEEFDSEAIESRLYEYARLKRKHKCDTAGLLAMKGEIEAKLNNYYDHDLIVEKLNNELKEAENAAMTEAVNLSTMRKEASEELQQAIRKQTEDLLLPNCVFKVDFKEKTLSPSGIDEVEYLVSMNKGEDLKPLSKTASGGEISRFMLGLKTVFASLKNNELMVFDEIDTGVSGIVAKAIGEKMKEIARNIQVLCITHLSPVAACANAHYFIYKKDDGSATSSDIRELNREEIIRELALISSGNDSKESLEAAEVLYNEAQA